MSNEIIGLLGFINSGKGTVGDLFQKYGYEKLSFAAPLKDAVAAMFGWPRHLLEGDTEESRAWREQESTKWSARLGRKITPRIALQEVGALGRERFGETLWVDTLFERVKSGHKYVITDVRYRNEIDTIRMFGGKIVRVKRGPEPAWFNIARDIEIGGPLGSESLSIMENSGVHVSEWDWIPRDPDYVIENEECTDYLSLLDKKVYDIIKVTT